jgi:phytoene synthase
MSAAATQPVLPPPSQADLAYVRALVQRSGSSFYWAMRFLPPEKSSALFAIYAFCREVDDIADDDGREVQKVAALAVWRRRIDALYAGTPDHAITRALAPALVRYGLQHQDFTAIIDGMEMDARGPIIAPSLATLDLYCDRVASAVGRLCILAFGESSEAGQQVAYHLGRALQLTNILRDVEEDAAIGRLYLPRELLDRVGVLVTTPGDVAAHPLISRVLAPLGDMAEAAFRDAERAIAHCSPAAIRPAVVMMKVYYRTLVKLRAAGWPAGLPASRGLARLYARAEKLGLALYYGLA